MPYKRSLLNVHHKKVVSVITDTTFLEFKLFYSLTFSSICFSFVWVSSLSIRTLSCNLSL